MRSDGYERMSLRRRLEVLKLPVTPMRRHGLVTPGERVAAGRVTDWGPSPFTSASQLPRPGPDLALISGSGPEYDVATTARIDRDGIRQGGRCRIVLPDGMEVDRLRFTSRGDALHGFRGHLWYRIDLDDLVAAAGRSGVRACRTAATDRHRSHGHRRDVEGRAAPPSTRDGLDAPRHACAGQVGDTGLGA